jgi:hypothetical protein
LALAEKSRRRDNAKFATHGIWSEIE